jgi:hypothetical protein
MIATAAADTPNSKLPQAERSSEIPAPWSEVASDAWYCNDWSHKTTSFHEVFSSVRISCTKLILVRIGTNKANSLFKRYCGLSYSMSDAIFFQGDRYQRMISIVVIKFRELKIPSRINGYGLVLEDGNDERVEEIRRSRTVCRHDVLRQG